jgi:prepilin-type N-terminal cleavage/methylation domain-containing protein
MNGKPTKPILEPLTAIAMRSATGRRSAGFSLIELLVVIAITLVLITLLFGPLIQGFQLTSRAQTATQAQDSARVAMEQITRELGSAAAVRDTTRQYLNLDMYTEPPGSGPQLATAHAYNAYIDIVPPRGAPGLVPDPTIDSFTNTSKLVKSSNGAYVLARTDVGLPIAPGTTIVRYFVGLREPINTEYTPKGTVNPVAQPYVNQNENQTFPKSGSAYSGTDVVQKNLNNPYILYRAEVTPYFNSGTPANPSYVVNADYFEGENGGTTTPVLDDPDFFNVLPTTTTEDDPGTGQPYTQLEIQQHNQRVYYWTQAAKPIIDINDVNLIFQPHDGKGNVQYAGANGYLANTTFDTDGTPIIRTSVSFEPAAVSGDSLNPIATSDVSQGYGTSPVDAVSPYIPTQYQASYGQWQGGPNVVVTGIASDSTTYTYSTFVYNPLPGAAALYPAGDLIETCNGTPVYDVSQGAKIGTPANYVAMSVLGDPGVVNFALPSLPVSGDTAVVTGANTAGDADPSNASNPYYYITFGAGAADLNVHLENENISSDPDLLPDTNLADVKLTPAVANDIPNGRIVVNSERVLGPDETAGVSEFGAPIGAKPINYQLVPYTRVALGTPIHANQYTIDYDTGVVDLGVPGQTINTSDPSAARRTALIAFSYQNDDDIDFDPTSGNITGVTPDTVRASYQTGSRIQVSIGVRIYDPSNRQPSYFSMTSAADVNNASR